MFEELNDNMLRSGQVSLAHQGQAALPSLSSAPSSGSELIISELCYFSRGLAPPVISTAEVFEFSVGNIFVKWAKPG